MGHFNGTSHSRKEQRPSQYIRYLQLEHVPSPSRFLTATNTCSPPKWNTIKRPASFSSSSFLKIPSGVTRVNLLKLFSFPFSYVKTSISTCIGTEVEHHLDDSSNISQQCLMSVFKPGQNISFSESDVDILIGKAWTTFDRLSTIVKSVVVSGLLYCQDSNKRIRTKARWELQVNHHHHHHHHHHIVPPARISLIISRYFSLSFIASDMSSGLHPVSSHSCCMYVRVGRVAFAWP